METQQDNQAGFVALISVLIISAILIILVVIVSTSSFFTRFNIQDYQNKKASASLAEACATTALVNVAKDVNSYPGSIPASGACVSLNGVDTCGGVANTQTCKICSVSGTAPNGPFTIVTRAAYGPSNTDKAYTNLTVSATLPTGATNFTINSWDETVTGPGSCSVP